MKLNLYQRFQNMRIRNKLSVVFISVMLVLMTIILVMANSILYNSNIEKTKQNILDDCQLIAMRLHAMYENVVTCADMVTWDINRIYQALPGEEAGKESAEYYSVKNNMEVAIDYDRRSFADVHSIIFVDNHENQWRPGLASNVDLNQLPEDMIEAVKQSGPPEILFFSIEDRDYLPLIKGESDGLFLTAGRRIISMNSGRDLGYILVQVKQDTIAAIFPEEEGAAYERNYYIVDENFTILSSKDKDLLQTSFADEETLAVLNDQNEMSFELDLGDGRYLVTLYPVEELGWTLINTISIEDLTRDIRTTSKMIVTVSLFGAALAILMIYITSGHITRPIKYLTEAAQKIQEEDFTVQCEVTSGDETGILSKVFNEMVIKIGELLVRVTNEQKKKREFELALIQAQIKPHFLYNTLDLIYVLCEMGDTKIGARITKALADFYRTSLSNGKEIISIREEVANAENYLLIQKERYCDLIDFKIEVDARIEQYKILKLTLQPLVENAIYHGLKTQKEKGCIWVKGHLGEEAIVLEIRDNGVGIDKERLEVLLTESPAGASEHFGLKNVHERIQLYFGLDYGLSIESETGKGTSVIITLPKGVPNELAGGEDDD